MKNGAYGLAALNGASLEPRDLSVVLGAARDSNAGAVPCVLAGYDATTAVHPRHGATGIDLLLGALDDPAAVAALLGRAHDTDPVSLATAACDRWGAGAAARLPGEWLLVRWAAEKRTLTVLTSACLHDPCYIASDGVRVAIAPDLVRLARLDWVDAAPDPEMLCRAMRPSSADRRIRRRTILRQVTQVLPGEMVVIRSTGLRIDTADPVPPPPLAAVSFKAAMADLDATLRSIVSRQLARSDDVAILLSGGLDSSLVAALAAAERRPGQRIVCLTSASPKGSRIADESGWAAAVADHLGLPLERVPPAADADIYRVRPGRVAGAAGPLLAPRHFLYDALEDAALAAGATALFEGSFGELTVSGNGPSGPTAPPRFGVRSVLRGLRDRVRGGGGDDPYDDYLVRPAATALSLDVASAQPWHRGAAADGAVGFTLGFDKATFRTTTAVDPRLRFQYPFRDLTLALRMAALPADYVSYNGIDRAPIRALLHGRVPDRIARRRSKMAFSPTYFQMLQAQAGTALGRIAEQRAAGAGEWLDLAWLEHRLADAMRGATLSRNTWSAVHATALFADFFLWWPQAVRGEV